MTTLKNKRKLVAVARETQEKHPKNSRSRNTSNPRNIEEHITHIYEVRVTKKLSHVFSRTASRILEALSKPNEFLFNEQVRRQSGTVAGTSRNTNVENQDANGYRSKMILTLKWDILSIGPIIQLNQIKTRLITGSAADTFRSCSRFSSPERL